MEIRTVKSVLHDKRGATTPFIAMMCIVIFILIAGSIEFIRVFTTVDTVIDRTNEAVTSTAAVNAPNFYAGMRESDGIAREFDGEFWTSVVITDEVQNVLCNILDLSDNNGELIKTVKNNQVFSIRDLQVTCNNTNPSGADFISKLEIEIPIHFANGILPSVKRNLTIKSRYIYLG